MSDADEDASVLGTHEHWQQTYEQELADLQEYGDSGEIWFGAKTMQAVLAFTMSLLPRDPSSCRVLDVGTGNGMLALELASRGCGHVTGTDYSPASLQLAAAVAAKHSNTSVQWVWDDILDSQLKPSWDVIVDKGTLDAIGLMTNALQARAAYKRAVMRLLSLGGVLVITSCNSSKDELIAEFSGTDAAGPDHVSRFAYVDHVRTYPVLKFAGKVGTRVCTVAFRKIECRTPLTAGSQEPPGKLSVRA